MSNPAPVYGDVLDVPTGTHFKYRSEAGKAGVHRQHQGGIVGTAKLGAESIALSGGYEDDEDHGSFVIYTGEGGRDSKTKRQIEHQKITRPHNAALVTSQMLNQPVRVLRGAHKGSSYGPPSGYRYDGCFFVRSHWMKTRRDGFQVIQFRLEQASSETAPEPEISEPEYSTTTVVRRIRDSAMSRKVKSLYSNQCQVCSVALTFHAGRTYAEGAHIRPLGRPHLGPDSMSNILCLCPNHHAQLDGGGFLIEDDGALTDTLTGASLGRLARNPGHDIDIQHFAYHRDLFSDAVAAPDEH